MILALGTTYCSHTEGQMARISTPAKIRPFFQWLSSLFRSLAVMGPQEQLGWNLPTSSAIHSSPSCFFRSGLQGSRRTFRRHKISLDRSRETAVGVSRLATWWILCLTKNRTWYVVHGSSTRVSIVALISSQQTCRSSAICENLLPTRWIRNSYR